MKDLSAKLPTKLEVFLLLFGLVFYIPVLLSYNLLDEHFKLAYAAHLFAHLKDLPAFLVGNSQETGFHFFENLVFLPFATVSFFNAAIMQFLLVGLHCLNAVLFCKVSKIVLQEHLQISPTGAKAGSGFAAFLFLASPLAVEAVSYLPSFHVVLGTTLALIGALSISNNKGQAQIIAALFTSTLLSGLSLASFSLLALFSKEQKKLARLAALGIVLILIFLLLQDLAVFRNIRLRNLSSLLLVLAPAPMPILKNSLLALDAVSIVVFLTGLVLGIIRKDFAKAFLFCAAPIALPILFYPMAANAENSAAFAGSRYFYSILPLLALLQVLPTLALFDRAFREEKFSLEMRIRLNLYREFYGLAIALPSLSIILYTAFDAGLAARSLGKGYQAFQKQVKALAKQNNLPYVVVADTPQAISLLPLIGNELSIFDGRTALLSAEMSGTGALVDVIEQDFTRPPGRQNRYLYRYDRSFSSIVPVDLQLKQSEALHYDGKTIKDAMSPPFDHLGDNAEYYDQTVILKGQTPAFGLSRLFLNPLETQGIALKCSMERPDKKGIACDMHWLTNRFDKWADSRSSNAECEKNVEFNLRHFGWLSQGYITDLVLGFAKNSRVKIEEIRSLSAAALKDNLKLQVIPKNSYKPVFVGKYFRYPESIPYLDLYRSIGSVTLVARTKQSESGPVPKRIRIDLRSPNGKLIASQMAMTDRPIEMRLKKDQAIFDVNAVEVDETGAVVSMSSDWLRILNR
ncbi:MAG: hypothetical protein K2Y32_09835 [Candidatus Obscuribacterales bacterium]|nr:hypothetical protein [Candidatus Obscuribacterales bacterium]